MKIYRINVLFAGHQHRRTYICEDYTYESNYISLTGDNDIIIPYYNVLDIMIELLPTGTQKMMKTMNDTELIR